MKNKINKAAQEGWIKMDKEGQEKHSIWWYLEWRGQEQVQWNWYWPEENERQQLNQSDTPRSMDWLQQGNEAVPYSFVWTEWWQQQLHWIYINVLKGWRTNYTANSCRWYVQLKQDYWALNWILSLLHVLKC